MSLLEALLAPAILATALLSLAQLLAVTTNATAAAGRITRSALLASAKVEELRASDAPLEADHDEPEAGYVREWTVTPLAIDPDHLALIDVVVRAPGATTRLVAVAERSAP